MKRRYSLWVLGVGCWMMVLSSCAQTRDTAITHHLTPNTQHPSPNTQAPTPITQTWCYPLPGAKVISPYGARGRRSHSGTDLKTKPNDNILAAFDGEVVFSGNYYGYGNLIRIKHDNGLETYYSHNSKNLVQQGDHVKAGDVIALTGRTGRATTEHLHFETRINGQSVNSARFFDHTTHQLRTDAFSKDGSFIKSVKSGKKAKKTKKTKKTKKALRGRRTRRER